MSFILEALKKSDKKRQDGTVPKLGTVHESVIKSATKRLHWIGLLLVLTLNTGILLWLFGPWQQPEIMAPTNGQNPSLQLASPVEIVKTQRRDTPTSAPIQDALHAQLPEMPIVKATPVVPATPILPVQKLQQPLPSPKPAEIPVVNSTLGTGPGKIYSLKELPPSFKSDIPEMHMSLHAFYPDDPAENLVRINDQIMRTGDRLDAKYLLDEISSDGAIFFYSGYRFLVPRKNLRHD